MKKGFTLAEVLITLGIIGVVAAITLPTLVASYKKRVVENRLKYSYSLLNQVVNSAQVDYGDLSTWDYTLDTSDFIQKYLAPYLKSAINDKELFLWGDLPRREFSFVNGTKWTIVKLRTLDYFFVIINVDINGKAKPNKQGIDIFNFYIFPEQRAVYNCGNGDVARNIPKPGIYYDGYGIYDNFNKFYRGCGYKNPNGPTYHSVNSYCIALIVRNNWKIPDDYPLKF